MTLTVTLDVNEVFKEQSQNKEIHSQMAGKLKR